MFLEQVKLSCSLKWLCRILSENDTLQELEDKQQLRNGSVKKLLLEPYNLGRLKKGVIDLLSDPGIYLGAYLTIHSGGNVEKKSFECLIHNLAKNGGYIVEDNDVVVNGSMLAQKKPFREVNLSPVDILLCQHSCNTIMIYSVKVYMIVVNISFKTWHISFVACPMSRQAIWPYWMC